MSMRRNSSERYWHERLFKTHTARYRRPLKRLTAIPVRQRTVFADEKACLEGTRAALISYFPPPIHDPH